MVSSGHGKRLDATGVRIACLWLDEFANVGR